MQIDLTTPALLFPAISLLLLAYTNRFLTIAQLIRQLKANLNPENYIQVSKQIGNLKKRVRLIIVMQALGVLSILFCTVSMIALFYTSDFSGHFSFGLSLFFMVASLAISLWEILISGKALDVELEEIKALDKRFKSDK
ncbi:MAG: DUF2721 domain-containing protein [Bacteroidota bacterium]